MRSGKDRAGGEESVGDRVLESKVHVPADHDHELEQSKRYQDEGVESAEPQFAIDVEHRHLERREDRQQRSDLPVLGRRRVGVVLGRHAGGTESR